MVDFEGSQLVRKQIDSTVKYKAVNTVLYSTLKHNEAQDRNDILNLVNYDKL